MEILTTRFGAVQLEPGDIVRFPAGMLGLEDCQDWVLLADAENETLGWLQSTSRAEVALAVVSPRRFVPDYQVRLARTELEPLAADHDNLHVLVIVGRRDDTLSLNLKAPL